MSIKRVVFIRPGETDWNRDERHQGNVAIPLNEHGRQQARRLANYIRNMGITALYTSDTKRALETAELLAERLGFTPIVDARLREREIGLWQGLTKNEMETWYPADYAKLRADPQGYAVPGGESRADVQKRMVAFFEELQQKEQGETVGIISHTTAIHELLEVLTPGRSSDDIIVTNTSVTTIRHDTAGWSLITSNDISHLEGLATRRASELEDNR